VITLQERVHSAPPPLDWSLNKLHRVFRVRKGYKNTGMQEDNLLWLSYGRIVNKSIDAAEGLLPESFETYQIVEPGNIVMRLTDLQNDKRSLRQGLVKERGIITSAYDALEVEKGHDPRFWAYALLALDLAKYYYSPGGGVRQSIKFADFPNDWIRAPNTETQKAIADFLDRETARIDKLKEKKCRLLELLSANKKLTVLHVLDRFHAPKVRTAPESYKTGHFEGGWSIQRVKHVVNFMTSGSRGWSQYLSDEGELFLQSGNITRDMDVDLADAQRIEPQIGAEADRTALAAGDVLVCITGGRTGAVGYLHDLNERAYVNQHICLLRARHLLLHPKLLAYLLYSEIGQRQLSFFQYGLKQGLGFTQVGEIKIPVPPADLQEPVLKEMDCQSQRMDRLSALLKNSNDRLSEFRSALITAAVTGQIDVSTWGKQGQSDHRLDQIEEALQA
jgi:type I restriction enzyme S subunit